MEPVYYPHHTCDEPTGSTGSTGPITGPHAGYDRDGTFDHVYWRCERCGLESTHAALREGCWRCRDAD